MINEKVLNLNQIRERKNIIDNLHTGDKVIIKSDANRKMTATINSICDSIIVFKHSSGLGSFKYSKKYLISSDIEIELTK